MKNHFLLFTLLFYGCQLGAQTMLPGNDCIAHRNGEKVILRDSTQLFQTFVTRNEAGADEFRLLPDGSREFVTTHHYESTVNDHRKKKPLSGQTIHFVFSGIPDAFFFSTDDFTWSIYNLTWVSGNTATLTVSPGNYDYIAYATSGSRILVKSGIQITNRDTMIQVNFNQAVNLITFKGYDENGNLLGQTQGYKIASCNVRFPTSRDMDYYTVLMSAGGTMRINDFSGGFSLLGGYYCHNLTGSHKVYFPQFQAINAVDAAMTVTNNPQDYVLENLEFYWKAGAAAPNLLIWNCIKNLRDYGWFYFAFGQQLALDSTSWSGKLFLTPDITEDIGFTTGFSILNTDELMPSWDETGFFKVEGSGMCNNFIIEPDMYIYPEGSTMTFGAGSASFRNIFINNQDGYSSIRCYHDIYGMNRDPRYEYYYDAAYQLFDGSGNLVSSGPYISFTSGSYLPGRYQLRAVNNECYFADSTGSHQVLTEFDLRLDDPDPPQLTSFQVRNSGSVPSFRLNADEAATVRFSLGDYLVDSIIYYPDYTEIVWNYEPVVNDSSRLFARIHGLANWQEVPLNVVLEDSAIGYLYEGDLAAFTTHQRSRLDVKISGYDQSGNMITHTWEPAVFVGDPATGTGEFIRPGSYCSLKAYPNPADGIVHFEIFCDHSAPMSLRIFDLCGREVRNLSSRQIEPGTISLEWNGKDDRGNPVPAGLYFYQCAMGEQNYPGKIFMSR